MWRIDRAVHSSRLLALVLSGIGDGSSELTTNSTAAVLCADLRVVSEDWAAA
jgi:hypothetical protein